MNYPLYLIWKTTDGKEQILRFDVVTNINVSANSLISEFPIEDGSIITDHIISKNYEISFNASVTSHPHQENPVINQDNLFYETVPGETQLVELPYPVFERYLVRIPDLVYPEEQTSLAGEINNLNLQTGIQTVIDAFTGGYKQQPARSAENQAILVPGDFDEQQATAWKPNDNVVNRPMDTYNTLELIRLSKQRCQVVMNNRIFNNMVITNIELPISPDIGESLDFNVSLKQIVIAKFMEKSQVVPIESIAQGSRNTGTAQPKSVPKSKTDELSGKNPNMSKVDQGASDVFL